MKEGNNRTAERTAGITTDHKERTTVLRNCHVSLSPLIYFILFSFYSISIISPFYYFLFFGVSLPAYVLPYYAAYILLLFTWHKHALFHSISYIIILI